MMYLFVILCNRVNIFEYVQKHRLLLPQNKNSLLYQGNTFEIGGVKHKVRGHLTVSNNQTVDERMERHGCTGIIQLCGITGCNTDVSVWTDVSYTAVKGRQETQ